MGVRARRWQLWLITTFILTGIIGMIQLFQGPESVGAVMVAGSSGDPAVTVPNRGATPTDASQLPTVQATVLPSAPATSTSVAAPVSPLTRATQATRAAARKTAVATTAPVAPAAPTTTKATTAPVPSPPRTTATAKPTPSATKAPTTATKAPTTAKPTSTSRCAWFFGIWLCY